MILLEEKNPIIETPRSMLRETQVLAEGNAQCQAGLCACRGHPGLSHADLSHPRGSVSAHDCEAEGGEPPSPRAGCCRGAAG